MLEKTSNWAFPPINNVKGGITIYDVYRGAGKPISVGDNHDTSVLIYVDENDGRITGVRVDPAPTVWGAIPDEE